MLLLKNGLPILMLFQNFPEIVAPEGNSAHTAPYQ
ncbi:Uncharacterised protein [Chlamydia trachomatis]|nr:Uncharacterised protein [Chlamydia trachomatis]